MEKISFTIEQIGVVKTDGRSFRIELDQRFARSLKELDEFSHADIIWWCHKYDSAEYRTITVSRKPYKNAPDEIGIFATRSPVRPNPIAITTVPIVSIDHEKAVIHIPFIDAIDGTPVIDIKPYHPSVERVRDVSVPDWCDHWPKWYEDSMHFDWAGEFENAQ